MVLSMMVILQSENLQVLATKRSQSTGVLGHILDQQLNEQIQNKFEKNTLSSTLNFCRSDATSLKVFAEYNFSEPNLEKRLLNYYVFNKIDLPKTHDVDGTFHSLVEILVRRPSPSAKRVAVIFGQTERNEQRGLGFFVVENNHVIGEGKNVPSPGMDETIQKIKNVRWKDENTILYDLDVDGNITQEIYVIK